METKLCKHCQTEIPKKAKVCPNCKKKQGGIVKWIVIIVVLFILIGSVIGSDDKTESKNETSNTSGDIANSNNTAEKETEIVYTPCEVGEMISLLDENALKAEKTYQDQYLEITGRLNVIDSDGNYITLTSVNDEFAIIGVQCYIQNDEQLEKVLEMKVGDTVTLKGKITAVGEVMGYSLDIDSIN